MGRSGSLAEEAESDILLQSPKIMVKKFGAETESLDTSYILRNSPTHEEAERTRRKAWAGGPDICSPCGSYTRPKSSGQVRTWETGKEGAHLGVYVILSRSNRSALELTALV